MKVTTSICLICDEVFEANGLYCPKCKEKQRLIKENRKPKPVHRKPAGPKTIVRNCSWCKKPFNAKKWGGVWTDHCDDCNERKPWMRLRFK